MASGRRTAQAPEDSPISLDHIIAQYGLLALFLGAGIEGETVAVIGGLTVHRGLLPFWPAVAAAMAGSFAADQIFFFLGRHFREHAFVRRMQRRPAFARVLGEFEKRPVIFVLAFRFLYGLRTVSPVAIGTTSLPARTFLLANVAAAMVWGLAFVTIGYWFGQGIESGFGRIRSLEHLLLGAGAALVVMAIALPRFLRWIGRLRGMV